MQSNEGSPRDLQEEVRQGKHQDRHAPIHPYLEDAARRERQKPLPDDIQ